MKQTILFLFIGLFVLFQAGHASGDDFESVDLYISGASEGQLGIAEPSGSNAEIAVIANNETSKGPSFQEVGRWSTNDLFIQSNISGSWSGHAWVYSSKAVTVTLRYSLIQNEETLDSFEFDGLVNADETVELVSDEEDFSLTPIDTSPLTLLIESSWNDQPGPPSSTNITINLEYASSLRDTHVQVSISHVQIKEGQEPYVNEVSKEVTLNFHVFDIFGVDDILSLSKNDYSMQMSPDSGVEAGSFWNANVTKVTDKNDYLEVRLVWFYGGHSLPAELSSYSIEFIAEDLLSSSSWTRSFTAELYITPEPDIEIDISSTKKTVDFGKVANYQLSLTNTGSGGDKFFVTADNGDNWQVNISDNEFTLEAGASKNIVVSVTVPSSTTDGQPSDTIVTVKADSDSDIRDSVTLQTTAREPAPKWDFTFVVDYSDNENTEYFIIKDRKPIEVILILTNEGNEDNNYNFEAASQDSAFAFTFSPSFISLSPTKSTEITLSISPADDYFGTSTYIEVIAKSAGGDNEEELETISIELQQSGSIDLRDSNLQIKASQGSSNSHAFQISNSDLVDGKRVYLYVSGVDASDKLVEDWISFTDKDGRQISDISFLTLSPTQTVEITLNVNIPSDADIGSYNFEISIYNNEKLRISDTYQFKVVSLETSASNESNLMIYIGLFSVLGVVGFGIYRNYSYDNYNDFDEYDDFDDLEEFPEIMDPSTSIVEVDSPIPSELPPMEPQPQAQPQPAIVPPQSQALSEVAPKSGKKWFGLFGGSKSESEPVVSQPVTAEPVVSQPVTAEPVVAQPVTAEPVVAQAVTAEPVVAQAVTAEPVVAQAVTAEPVVAQAVTAEPVVAQAVTAEPVVAQPVIAEVVVAQPVIAEVVVAQPVTVQIVEDEDQ